LRATRADVVVVGGGSAGCVLAARLSEDPARRVTLVEDGPDPQPIPGVVANPRRQAELVLESPYVRMYDTARADGSSFPLLSGRIMGGGSSINNMVVVRPMRADFDAWAAAGGPAWSYDALLPLMRAIESDPDFADSPLHGADGPLRLERSFTLDGPLDPPVEALVRAAGDLGLPPCPDLNVPEPFGVCASPYAIHGGARQSATVAYLDPVRGRANLEIRADTAVTRLLLDGDRATGVEVVRGGTIERIDADAVVLAAGVYHSPQLLQLSGIGPADALAAAGIPVRLDRAGVGAGYQDHAVVYVTYTGTADLREEYVIPKVRLIARSSDAVEHPDLHIFFRPSVRVPGLDPMLPVSLHLLDHRSRGTVRLASADPADMPIVEPALLEDPDDVRALVDGIGLVERLVRHPALAAFYGTRLLPEPGADEEEHVRASYETYHHGVGTCRLGPADDPAAVVGPDLRLHGLRNVWVADASVLPTIPRANTNLAAYLVGEIGARSVAAATGGGAR
jgi:choline dehydrogenase